MTGDGVTFDADLPHHFETPKGGGGPARRAVGRAAPIMASPRCSTRSGTRTRSSPGLHLHRPPPRPRGHSPQAFDGLRLAGRRSAGPDRTLATADHNVPTDGTRRRHPRGALPRPGGDPRAQLRGVRHPRLLARLRAPGDRPHDRARARRHPARMTIVCGDTTRRRRRVRRACFGIGTSEVEHVLATQTLAQPKPKSMRISYGRASASGDRQGPDPRHGRPVGTGGAAGHAVEYAGPAIEALSMEGRMTICNMTIEGGGRAGLPPPTRRPSSGSGAAPPRPRTSPPPSTGWRELRTDDGATFRRRHRDRRPPRSPPLVTWGTYARPGGPVSPGCCAHFRQQRVRGARARVHAAHARHAARRASR